MKSYESFFSMSSEPSKPPRFFEDRAPLSFGSLPPVVSFDLAPLPEFKLQHQNLKDMQEPKLPLAKLPNLNLTPDISKPKLELDKHDLGLKHAALEMGIHHLEKHIEGIKYTLIPKAIATTSVLEVNSRFKASKESGHSTTASLVCASIATGTKQLTSAVGSNQVLKMAALSAAPETLGTSLMTLGGLALLELGSDQLGNAVQKACHATVNMATTLNKKLKENAENPVTLPVIPSQPRMY